MSRGNDIIPANHLSLRESFAEFRKLRRGPDCNELANFPPLPGKHALPGKNNSQYNKLKREHEELSAKFNADLNEDMEAFASALLSGALEALVSGGGRITPEQWQRGFWSIKSFLIGLPGEGAILDLNDGGLASFVGKTPYLSRDAFREWEENVVGDWLLDQVHRGVILRKDAEERLRLVGLSVPKRGAKRGPKPKVDPEEFYAEVARYLDDEGIPDPKIDPNFRQAELERHMMKWHQDRISESQNRARVVKAIERYSATKAR